MIGKSIFRLKEKLIMQNSKHELLYPELWNADEAEPCLMSRLVIHLTEKNLYKYRFSQDLGSGYSA